MLHRELRERGVLAASDGEVAPHLRAALELACTRPGALRTVFQPIADLARGAVAGYEALTRIELEPRMGPDRWFALAHAAGLGPRLEALAVRAALAARRALPPDCFLTVNVAPGALLSEQVRATFEDADDLRGVVIELTEQEPVDDYDLLLEALAQPVAAGAQVAVDDAGAGFASLTHITRLRPQLVKIDRAHVSGIERDPAKVAAVETLGELASRLDAWVLAEGVETRAELDVLLELGVPLAQGWLLGRPGPAMAGPTEALMEARTAAGPHGVVVVVDEHGRPLELQLGAASGRGFADALAVTLDTPLRALVHRLLARPAATRLDPVVGCDERGRAIGLITVERILAALAGAPAAAVAPLA